MRAVAVVDGITIGKGLDFYHFGRCWDNSRQDCGVKACCQGCCCIQSGCPQDAVTLDADEKVQSIIYGRSTNTSYRNLICRLSFHTNKRVLGEFSPNRCSEPKYRVDIPSEMMLEDYFGQYTKTKLTWTASGMKPFFNGFTSEYTTCLNDYLQSLFSFSCTNWQRTLH